ncbi:hypothetical protein [Methyloglobulus sp.]|uniref:hypothetical protein n=1 Tax=Methyloglobulus sp. TaxID=2518622 RepID=UPI0032B7EBD1
MTIQTLRVETSQRDLLRLPLAGDWNARDMANLMEAMEQFYIFFLLADWQQHAYDGPILPTANSVQHNFAHISSANIEDVASYIERVTNLHEGSDELVEALRSATFTERCSRMKELSFALSDLYEFRNTNLRQDIKRLSLRNLGTMPPLRVLKVRYASPGFADFSGIGLAIGHLKDLVIELFTLPSKIKAQKLELEKTGIEIQSSRLELERKQLAILRERLDFLRSLNYSQEQLLGLEELTTVQVGRLLTLIQKDLITSPSATSDEDS